MKRPSLEKLKDFKGKSFHYAGKTYKLLDYSISDHYERVTIKTDLRTFEKSYDQFEEFVYLLVPTEEPVKNPPLIEDHFPETKLQPAVVVTAPEPPAPATDGVYQEHSALAKDLITILKENIQKVRASKDYIPQAQAINNNVNSIINVTKLQLDVYKQFKGKKQSSS